MKVRFTSRPAALVGTLVLLAGWGIATSVAAKGGAQEKADPARIEISPEQHDFGNAPQNQKLVHDFTITNIGGSELRIGRISTSCGCTAALPESRTIAPGESTTLKVTLETRKYRGTLERSVSIASSDPRKLVRIKVKAFVETN